MTVQCEQNLLCQFNRPAMGHPCLCCIQTEELAVFKLVAGDAEGDRPLKPHTSKMQTLVMVRSRAHVGCMGLRQQAAAAALLETPGIMFLRARSKPPQRRILIQWCIARCQQVQSGLPPNQARSCQVSRQDQQIPPSLPQKYGKCMHAWGALE